MLFRLGKIFTLSTLAIGVSATQVNEPQTNITTAVDSTAYRDYSFKGTDIDADFFRDGSAVIHTLSNTPPISVILNAAQAQDVIMSVCDEMPECNQHGSIDFSAYNFEYSAELQQSIPNTHIPLDLTHASTCDEACLGGEATLLCSNYDKANEPGIRIAFDMPQAGKIARAYCQEFGTCSFSDSHKVTSGQSLWSIAEIYYGDGFLYPAISAENARKYPSLETSSEISTSMTLTIPSMQVIRQNCANNRTLKECGAPSLR